MHRADYTGIPGNWFTQQHNAAAADGRAVLQEDHGVYGIQAGQGVYYTVDGGIQTVIPGKRIVIECTGQIHGADAAVGRNAQNLRSIGHRRLQAAGLRPGQQLPQQISFCRLVFAEGGLPEFGNHIAPILRGEIQGEHLIGVRLVFVLNQEAVRGQLHMDPSQLIGKGHA